MTNPPPESRPAGLSIIPTGWVTTTRPPESRMSCEKIISPPTRIGSAGGDSPPPTLAPPPGRGASPSDPAAGPDRQRRCAAGRYAVTANLERIADIPLGTVVKDGHLPHAEELRGDPP